MAKYMVILEIESDDGNPSNWDWYDLLGDGTDLYYLHTIDGNTHKDKTSYIKKVVEMIDK